MNMYLLIHVRIIFGHYQINKPCPAGFFVYRHLGLVGRTFTLLEDSLWLI